MAEQAVDEMNFSPVSIGISPQMAGPDGIGIIGLPVWMWAADRTPETTGPMKHSVSAGGYTVAVEAALESIDWDMGDGTTVSCKGPGTPYAKRYGKQESPTCGHTYTKQGVKTVKATSHWRVAWSGIGQTGTIPVDVSDSTQLTMAELQVIVK
jgi:hypothetical protein